MGASILILLIDSPIAVLVCVSCVLGWLAPSATDSLTAFDIDGVERLRTFGGANHACIDSILAIIHDPRRTAHLDRLEH